MCVYIQKLLNKQHLLHIWDDPGLEPHSEFSVFISAQDTALIDTPGNIEFTHGPYIIGIVVKGIYSCPLDVISGILIRDSFSISMD